MPGETIPVATVTGLYRATDAGLEPLTKETPLTPEEIRRYPLFYELALTEEVLEADVIADMSWDNMEPVRLQNLYRGIHIPHGVRFWPGWFEIPPYREMRDVTGRMVYPRAPGVHTVRIRTAKRPRTRQLRERDFAPENRSWTSPLFELSIAAGV
jgi:hypothetical protein